MMVNSKTYKGIDYVQVSGLPQAQRDLLANTLNKSMIIKILVNGKIENDCLQFTDYKTWFENIYSLQTVINSSTPAPASKTSDRAEIFKRMANKVLVNS